MTPSTSGSARGLICMAWRDGRVPPVGTSGSGCSCSGPNGPATQIDVAVNSDLEQHPEVVDGYSMLVSVGHDEYWSWGMRDTAESFVERGGNIAFLSGNSVCWQVRFEDDGHTMVSYKADPEADPLYGTDQQHLVSTLWCSQIVGRPENHLTGLSFSRGGYIRMGNAVPKASGGYTTWRPDHWVFAGTDVHYGDLFGTKDSIVVYEVDGCEFTHASADGLPVPTGRDGTPKDFTILATAPARLWAFDELPSRYRSSESGDLEETAAAVFGEATAGEHRPPGTQSCGDGSLHKGRNGVQLRHHRLGLRTGWA